MNFKQSLRYEEKRLINVINIPVEEIKGRCVYIGPTKVDFSMIQSKSRMIPTVEMELFKKWKAIDNYRYTHQQTEFWG